MKKCSVLLAAGLLSAGLAGAAHASSVSYYLNQNNFNTTGWPDGNDYLKVTIDNNDAAHPDYINFRIETLSQLNNAALTNFGIQSFDFNTTLPTSDYSTASFVNLPSGWGSVIAPPLNTSDGFGKFDLEVSNSGSNRQSILTFSIAGVAGDSLATYATDLSTSGGNNPPAQGAVLFSAHVADFTGGTDSTGAAVTSGYFGGGPQVVPVPAALWLFGSGLVGLVGVGRRRRPV